jgi:hypothetical protein
MIQCTCPCVIVFRACIPAAVARFEHLVRVARKSARHAKKLDWKIRGCLCGIRLGGSTCRGHCHPIVHGSVVLLCATPAGIHHARRNPLWCDVRGARTGPSMAGRSVGDQSDPPCSSGGCACGGPNGQRLSKLFIDRFRRGPHRWFVRKRGNSNGCLSHVFSWIYPV